METAPGGDTGEAEAGIGGALTGVDGIRSEDAAAGSIEGEGFAGLGGGGPPIVRSA